MNRLTYLLAFCAVLYGVGSAMFGGGEGPRRPRESIAPPRQSSPPQTPPPMQSSQTGPRGPTIEIEVGTKGSSTGTAFAITDDGWWLTARHVAHGCDTVWIQTAPRKGFRVLEIHLHPNADLALLRTQGRPAGRAPLRLAGDVPGRGADGFSLGFPEGRAGDIHARAIGQARMRSVGRYRINEPILAWAEVTRRPRDLPALGGLSGGPMLDDQGRVVGVLVASSKRRGRVMTTSQTSIQELLAQFPAAQSSPGAPVGHATQPISSDSFISRGQDLRQDLTIAKVICQVRQTRRRP